MKKCQAITRLDENENESLKFSSGLPWLRANDQHGHALWAGALCCLLSITSKYRPTTYYVLGTELHNN